MNKTSPVRHDFLPDDDLIVGSVRFPWAFARCSVAFKIWVLLALVICSSTVLAQNVASSVRGMVLDPTQLGVPDAATTLTDQATGRTWATQTWVDGSFTYANVPPGTYAIRVEAPGFKILEIKDVVVHANEVRALGNLVLQVGLVRETLSVAADAAVPAVQLGSGERSGLVSGTQLNEIALKGRDFWAMLQTLPGVVDNGSQGRETISWTDNRGTYINGGSDQSKNYSVDGIFSMNTSNSNTVIQPNLDATAEVKVLTTNYQAEYGRMSSGVISVVTKSGSRDFHGSGWANFRHEKLNANSFFNNRTGTPKSRYRYQIYGYSIGGPVYIPNKFNTGKSKLFFFFSQEFDPITTDYGTMFATMPTALEREGDFSHSYDVNGALIVIRDPVTGKPFPGNVVPPGRISSLGQALLKSFPLPNYTDPNPKNLYQWNYRSRYSASTPLSNTVLRLDYDPFESMTLTYRLLLNHQDVKPPWKYWEIDNNFLMTPVKAFTPGTSHLAQLTNTFSPTLINEFKFAYTLSNVWSDYADRSKVMRSATGNLPQVYADSGSPDFSPDISFGSNPANAARISIGPGDWYWRGTQYSFIDTITKAWSRHTLKAGFALDYYRAVGRDTRSTWRGAYSFARDPNNPFDTNHGFSNALLGTFDTYSELTGRAYKDTVLKVFEEYIQDNWRLTQRLTLDLGLRFVSQPPEFDRHSGAVAHFDPALYVAGKSPLLYAPALNASGQRVGQDPTTGALVPAAYIGLFVSNTGDPANGSGVCGSNGYPKGCFHRKRIFLAPRFGFAFDLFGNGKTALRGGVGVFYDTPDANSFESSEGNPPTSYTTVHYYGDLSTLASSTGLIGPSTLPNQVAFGQISLPRTTNFSFGIQQQLPKNLLLDLAYVGSQVQHMLLSREINPIPMFARFNPANADPTSPGTPLPDDFLRRYAGYGSITTYEMSGTSNYNSLQAALNRRFSRGFQVGVAYTFSKTLGATGTSPYFVTRQWMYGRLPQDRRHVFVANYIYDLPKFGTKAGFRAARWVFDNWQVSGLTTFSSGAPVSPAFRTTDGQDITGSSENARVTIVGDPNLPKDQRSFYRNFNTDVFVRTPQGGFGNAGIGILTGPGVNNWDIAISKTFPLWNENRNLRFRAEFFNAWNHTQFSAIDATAMFNPAGQQVNPTFGAFTAARSPRIIQLSARIAF